MSGAGARFLKGNAPNPSLYFNFFNNDFFFLGWKLAPNPGGIAKSD